MPKKMSHNGHAKTFVLDTNVLLHNPNAIFLLADNEIIIPFDVIEELDKFKTGNDDLGRNARTVIRHLDRLREAGKLADGVAVQETGGVVRVVRPLEPSTAGTVYGWWGGGGSGAAAAGADFWDLAAEFAAAECAGSAAGWHREAGLADWVGGHGKDAAGRGGGDEQGAQRPGVSEAAG